HQYFVPGRTTDVMDWLADTVGAVLCVVLWQAYKRRRRGQGGRDGDELRGQPAAGRA
ncbi:MAG TPA: VanZ family protein, partial [Myxococcota bacterium]|nr:VanZ family protein [Myxococcota bacterium]